MYKRQARDAETGCFWGTGNRSIEHRVHAKGRQHFGPLSYSRQLSVGQFASDFRLCLLTHVRASPPSIRDSGTLPSSDDALSRKPSHGVGDIYRVWDFVLLVVLLVDWYTTLQDIVWVLHMSRDRPVSSGVGGHRETRLSGSETASAGIGV